MPYNVEETGQLSRTAQVVVPRDEYQRDVDSALRKLSGRVKLRGFRKGKIPMGVMRKRYGDAVQRDVVDSLVQRYVNEILDESGEDVVFVAQPQVTKFDQDGVGLEFNVDFELRPAVDPIGYLGLEVEKPRVEVESADIDEELEKLRRQFSSLEPIELRQTIKEGDIVTFDFRAVDEDASAAHAQFRGEDTQIEVGEETVLAGLTEALVGAAFDATLTVTVTPGEDFSIPELRGEDIEIEISIKSVKQRRLPDLDDDFAQDTGEAETLLELRQKVRESLAHSREHDAHHHAENDLVEKLLDQNDFELPPRFLREQIDRDIRQQLQQLQQQGIDPTALDLDLEDLREALRPEKEVQIRTEFLLMAIARKEKLEVGDEDLQRFFEHQVMHTRVSVQQLVNFYRQDRSRMQQAMASALLEKTVRYLLEKAEIREVDWPTEEELAARAAAREEEMQKRASEATEKVKAKKATSQPKKEAPAEAAPAASSVEGAPAEAAGDDVAARLESMTVDELKDLLRANDLKVSGKKSDLVERLVDAGVTL